jgi:hypothetical protein
LAVRRKKKIKHHSRNFFSASALIEFFIHDSDTSIRTHSPYTVDPALIEIWDEYANLLQKMHELRGKRLIVSQKQKPEVKNECENEEKNFCRKNWKKHRFFCYSKFGSVCALK